MRRDETRNDETHGGGDEDEESCPPIRSDPIRQPLALLLDASDWRLRLPVAPGAVLTVPNVACPLERIVGRSARSRRAVRACVSAARSGDGRLFGSVTARPVGCDAVARTAALRLRRPPLATPKRNAHCTMRYGSKRQLEYVE